MIRSIEKAFFGSKPSKKRAVNELNQILYGQLANSNHVVWYNFDNKIDYIKKGYQGNAQVYSIIKMILDKCRDAHLICYEEKEDRKSFYKSFRRNRYSRDPVTKAVANTYLRKALEFDDKSDLYKLLENPNQHDTMADLMYLFGIFYQSMGEAFLYRETAIDSDIALSLHVAPANLMVPVYSGDTEDIIEGWKLTLLNGENRTLDAKDVFHMKMPNPNFDSSGSQLRGQSPLLAGAKYLMQSDKGIDSWVKAMENEGAKGIVAPKGNDPKLWLQPHQVKETKDNLEARIHGSDNLHKISVSGMPLEYHQIGLSPQALNIIEGLKYSDVKLCTLWNVDPVLFDPQPTYENKKQAQLRLVTDVVIPYLNTIEQGLAKWLVQPFSDRDGKNYVIDFDTSEYVELKVDIDTAIKLVGAGLITINEARGMLNWDDLDEDYANQVFIQAGLIPLSDYSSDMEM